MLSLRKSFLSREIHYWCQFCNGVMVKDLWCRSETESLLWMCTQDFAAWRMSVSRSLVMIHYGITLMCYLPLTFPWNNFYVVCEEIKQHLSFPLDQKGIPLSCVVLFLLILVVTTHTSSLYILCVKVKPWSFLVLENNWLALKIEICFPAAEMQEFVHSLSYLIHVFPNQVDNSSCIKKRMNNMTKWIFTQMHDLLFANVNSQPLAYQWYWEDLLNVKSSSTSWFWLTCNCPMNECWV